MRLKALLLAVILMLSAIVTACSDQKDSGAKTTNTNDTAPAGERNNSRSRLHVRSPQRDLGGLTINFLTPNSEHDPDWAVWSPRDIYARSRKQRDYKRRGVRTNRMIEELYNVKIANDGTNDSLSELQRAVTATTPFMMWYKCVSTRYRRR